MSLNLWNLWDVKPPPMCKTKVRLKHKEINNLKKLLFEIVSSLRNMKELEFEAALLSRLMYKSKRMFRHDKGLQNMVKMNQCLKRYLKLNMVKVVDEFNKNLPGKLPQDATHAYLPTRQTFEWVLFRFQAFGQLLARLGRLAQKAGPQLYSKLCLGWALKPTLCFYASNSRLLVLSKFLVVKSIEWYDSLRRYLPLFESTAPFLGGKHEFPVDLKKFLGEVDFFTPPKRSGIDKIFEMIDLSVDDDEGDVTNVHRQLFKPFLKVKTIEIDSDVEEIHVEEEEEEVVEIPKNRKLEDVDLGVPVGKRTEKVFHATAKKKRKIGMENKFA